MDYKQLADKFPFLTVAIYSKQEYIGIIQNSSKSIVSLYWIDLIRDKPLLKKFLELGEAWWYESNRIIPINIFIGEEFKVFRPTLKTFNAKEFKILQGPVVALTSNNRKRVKRKSIIFLKVPPSNSSPPQSVAHMQSSRSEERPCRERVSSPV